MHAFYAKWVRSKDDYFPNSCHTYSKQKADLKYSGQRWYILGIACLEAMWIHLLQWDFWKALCTVAFKVTREWSQCNIPQNVLEVSLLLSVEFLLAVVNACSKEYYQGTPALLRRELWLIHAWGQKEKEWSSSAFHTFISPAQGASSSWTYMKCKTSRQHDGLKLDFQA